MKGTTAADRAIINNTDAAEAGELIRRDAEKSLVTAQREKEEALADIYEAAGKIKSSNFVKKQAEFFNLIMLKKVKESKEYRERFGMTWVQFCEYVGVEWRKVDEQLADLKPFKVEFLTAFVNFSGMPLNKVKYLAEPEFTESVKISTDGKTITYKGEIIPVDAEHAEDLQTLIADLEESYQKAVKEKALEATANDKVLVAKEQLINKYAKDLSRLEGQAAKLDLLPTEAGFLKEMDNLRTGFDGYLLRIEPSRIYAMFQEDEDDKLTPRMRAAYISSLDYMKKQILMAFNRGETIFGSAVMCPESAGPTE